MKFLRVLRVSIAAVLTVCRLLSPASPAPAADSPNAEFVDLSLLVAPEYPCTWPTWPRFVMKHYERIGPLSPYNSDVLIIDGNTGTQLDVPPHSVAAPDTRLPNSGP